MNTDYYEHIDRLQLSPSQVRALKKCGIVTISDLKSYILAGKDLCDIQGIGKKGKSAIIFSINYYSTIHENRRG